MADTITRDMKITSIDELRDWNDNNFRPPEGEEKVYVLQWWLDWIFDDVLKRKDYNAFKNGMNTFVEFTVIYENKTFHEALMLTFMNLKYWWDRASKDDKPFRGFYNKLLLEYFGG